MNKKSFIASLIGMVILPQVVLSGAAYKIDLSPQQAVNIILPAYCIDSDKDAPENGVELNSQPQKPDLLINKVMLVGYHLLAEKDYYLLLWSKYIPLQEFSAKTGELTLQEKEKAYNEAIEKSIQWALWRLSTEGFARVIKSRLEVPLQYRDKLSELKTIVSENRLGMVNLEEYMPEGEQLDASLKASLKKLFDDIKALKRQGTLIDAKDSLLEYIEDEISGLESTLNKHIFAYWLSAVILETANRLPE